MHRLRAWGLSAALAVAAGAAAQASDPPRPAPTGRPTTVYDRFFNKPKTPPADAKTSLRPTTGAPVLPPGVLAGALSEERDAWNRRMAVCLKVRETAEARGDERLLRQVEDMERQATELYHARAAALGVARTRPADVLDRELGTGVAASPLTAPAPPTPAGPATAAARTADTVREVRP